MKWQLTRHWTSGNEQQRSLGNRKQSEPKDYSLVRFFQATEQGGVPRQSHLEVKRAACPRKPKQLELQGGGKSCIENASPEVITSVIKLPVAMNESSQRMRLIIRGNNPHS